MITSIQNERIKHFNKLKRKKYRDQENCFLIEGIHLIEEAIRSCFPIVEIFHTEEVQNLELFKNVKTTLVSKEVIHYLSQTESPQGIVAVVKMKENTHIDTNRVLLIDAVQDPGNLGTLIRTAKAFRYEKIILGKGTVDCFNDKVIRATQGALFHIDIQTEDLQTAILRLKTEGFEVWASTLNDAVSSHNIKPSKKLALILGNEGKGIEEKYINLATKKVTIPLDSSIESLNVAIAGSILMYETTKTLETR